MKNEKNEVGHFNNLNIWNVQDIENGSEDERGVVVVDLGFAASSFLFLFFGFCYTKKKQKPKKKKLQHNHKSITNNGLLRRNTHRME